jgi:hypothetical protein
VTRYFPTCSLIVATVVCVNLGDTQKSIKEIRLEHLPGAFSDGKRGKYEIVLRPDGTCSFSGNDSDKLNGRYHGVIAKGEFDHLGAMVNSHGFFDLKDHYAGSRKDVGLTKLTVARGDSSKTVAHLARSEPQRLWEIESALRGVLAGIDWVKDESEVDE